MIAAQRPLDTPLGDSISRNRLGQLGPARGAGRRAWRALGACLWLCAAGEALAQRETPAPEPSPPSAELTAADSQAASGDREERPPPILTGEARVTAPMAPLEAPQGSSEGPANDLNTDDASLALVPRVLGTLSAGLPLRLRRDRDLGQGRLGPRFVDGSCSYLWSSHGRLQHGPGMGLALNLSGDGGFFQPVDPWSQWVVTPAYSALYLFEDDLLGVAHLGLPIAFAADKSVGVELAAGGIYKLLSGLGVFAEVGITAYGGAGGTLHPMLTAELGLAIDYEVLP